jgi:hypothetical protein
MTALACSQPASDEARPSRSGAATANGAAEERPAAAARAQVVFLPEGRPAVPVSVAVARTPRQIQRGLMYREHLPPDAGMLFLFRRSKVQSFWMKNTLIPLDMIFVSSDLEVVGVVENAEPKTLTSRSVDRPSLYVVEVNGGWARAHGVAPGTRISFENVRPLTAADGDYD